MVGRRVHGPGPSRVGLVLCRELGARVLGRRILLRVLRIGHVGLLTLGRVRTATGFPSRCGRKARGGRDRPGAVAGPGRVGLTVAVVSLPAARITRSVPRRYLLTGLLGLPAATGWVSALGSVSYGLPLAARVVTVSAQASFWVVMGPVAVGLFPPERRGRVMGLLSVGGSLATVLGVPAVTWRGGHGGRRAPFVVLGALALVSLVSLVVIAALLPVSRPQGSHAAYGTDPDRRRFLVVVATTALSVTGLFAGFT
ncbi:MFS transporter [Streptomyces sp. NPDC001604]|uniref:MFS transporter n=1 Tax=Streptomyces sp. NPDC001604 TaxID=3364593 RepID=UPI0036A8111D